MEKKVCAEKGGLKKGDSKKMTQKKFYNLKKNICIIIPNYGGITMEYIRLKYID